MGRLPTDLDDGTTAAAVRLPTLLWDRIIAEAHRQGLTVSALVRAGMERLLDDLDGQVIDLRDRPALPTADEIEGAFRR